MKVEGEVLYSKHTCTGKLSHYCAILDPWQRSRSKPCNSQANQKPHLIVISASCLKFYIRHYKLATPCQPAGAWRLYEQIDGLNQLARKLHMSVPTVRPAPYSLIQHSKFSLNSGSKTLFQSSPKFSPCIPVHNPVHRVQGPTLQVLLCSQVSRLHPWHQTKVYYGKDRLCTLRSTIIKTESETTD